MGTKKTFWIVGGVTAILFLLVALRVWSNVRNSHRHDQVDNLTVAMGTAKVQPMPLTLTAVGQVVSEHSVQIRPQVSGMLKEVYFTEGQNVAAGQKLFLIDPAPYEAALISAKATWENAKANADRLEPLAKQDFATPQEYENARATADQAEAAYKQAQINLSYTDIRAPIAGRTGSLSVKSGNIVAPTDSLPLVAVNQMQPIQVQFQLAQQFLPQVRDYDARRELKVMVTREDGSGHLDDGKLVFIDNAVNTATGTVMFKAGLPNQHEQLWPGQYVGVTLQLALQQDAVVVPQSAVLTGQQGNYIYVVKDGVAAQQDIKVDRQIGDLAVISAGLKGGEQIVTEVPRNLRPGLHVTAAPTGDEPAPQINVPGFPVMNLSAPFIHRPVMTTVIMAGLLVFGMFAYTSLPVSELPSVDFPTINVSASLPGANPENMASSVATPLERQFSSIAGLTSMSSTNGTGNTNITLQFDLSRNIDAAAQDVQTAISQSIRQLPVNMPTPPTLRKVNPADYAIIYLSLTADTLPLTQLDEYAETRVAEQLSQINGVAQVIVFGSYQYAARIYVNPYALSARGLSLNQLSSAIQANNTNLPSGTLYGSNHTYTVQSDGQLTDAAAYDRMIVAYQNGAPVHLSDVATAVDGVQQDKQLTTFSDADDEHGKMRPAIVLAIKRQPGANTVAVSQAVQALMPEITRQAPGDAVIHVLYDRASFIKGSIGDVRTTLLLAVVLVVCVIFLFLRNIRATLISALALPTSVIGTFAIMQLAGFSLDNLSLMALTLAVGFVVDDAIVVLENIVRYREQGEPSMRAALIGSQEIGFTVVSMTLSLVAVFIPILFMGGIVGRLFSEFAMTVGIAILISGFVSLTLTPMLCSRFLKESERHGKLYDSLENGFDRMRDLYRVGLTWAVDHWGAMLGVGGAILLLTFVLFALVPKGFIPSEDTGQVIGNTQAPEGITFSQLNGMQQRVAQIVQQNPGVQAIMSSAGQGGGGTNGSNIGRLFIGLKPMSDRKKADAILEELRKAVAPVHDMQVYFQNPPAVNVGSVQGNAQYQFVLQGPDIDSLYAAAPKFEQQLDKLPGIQDVSSDLQLDNPQINVDINREAASSLGVNAQEVQSILYAAYGGQQVSTIYGATNEYWVMLQLAPQFQSDIGALNALYVQGANNSLVPLRAVANIKPSVGPLQVNHYAQLPAVTLSFNLAPGLSLGTVTSKIEAIAQGTLPSDVTGSFAGNAQTFKQSMVDLPILLLVTILVIYMVLAILYEHFIHPITILTALPLAMVGALLSLLLFGEELNIFSFVGLIMLVGLVKKNGIIMVDFALQIRREKGLSARDAIIEACLVRFRPIMMTTMAAILGTLPIALGFGMGAEARRGLGIATVGGLIFSQMLTLFLTPAFYVAMEHLSARLGEGKSEAEPEPEPSAVQNPGHQ